MKIVEMPETISNPCLKCPHHSSNTSTTNETEIKVQENEKISSNRLMAALQSPISDQENSNTKGSSSCWKVLQCSAFLPLWDYRKLGRVETKVEDNSLESEIKISEWIVSQYYQNYQVEHLDPFIVLHASCHWIRNQDFLCIHLKPVASTKKDGGLGIMDNIVRLTNVIVDFEIQRPSLLGLD